MAPGGSPDAQRPAGGRDGDLHARAARQALTSSRPDPGPRLHAQAQGSVQRFLNDGRVSLSNNAAERALRGVAMGRKSWLFCGSDRGGQRAAVMCSLIVTARLNNIGHQAWLTDVLARTAERPSQQHDDLPPWNCRPLPTVARAA